MKRNQFRLYTLFALLMSPGILLAQADAPTFNFGFQELLWTAVLLMAVVLLLLVFVLQRLVFLLRIDAMGPDAVKKEKRRSLWDRITALRPMSEEKDLLMDHDYDGIKELDNPTPPWFNFLFYGTIMFAVIYLVKYHVIGDGKVMENEYQAQMMEWDQKKKAYLATQTDLIDETNVELITDDKKLEEFQALFVSKCAPCHGEKAEGRTGPNLTDPYWLHGGGIKNVFKTIKYGVPAKGMISWEKLLKADQIQGLASYIISIQGTVPEGVGKAPQGSKYDPEASADDSGEGTPATTDSTAQTE